MDNFEWTSGYNSPYGIYYVDRATLLRTPKLSAKWYAQFLANEISCDNPKSTSNRGFSDN
ncbi:Beta-glucosidase 44 [Bienertia sinuspersici]